MTGTFADLATRSVIKIAIKTIAIRLGMLGMPWMFRNLRPGLFFGLSTTVLHLCVLLKRFWGFKGNMLTVLMSWTKIYENFQHAMPAMHQN